MESKPKEVELDENVEEVKTVKALTNKEIKAKWRPEFEANPSKYYPTKVFDKIGFTRNKCPKCGGYYWRHSEKADTCGDSKCVGSYKFIGKKLGVGNKEKLTYANAWKSFEKSLTSARVPCKAIDRYPVVARWRNDVDYVAAGIFCFQPYCVTGELDPPANPLICPQFCVRFNDLDNIGITGRHYSGFIMLGIQVFNKPDNFVFFSEDCVEFNYRWLTEELLVDPDDITFVEDIWAGGGNMGPSMEYFINGMEIGNMVFMQFKTFHDGNIEELPIKIIDVGIGLERIPWLINGSATSYIDVFQNAFSWLSEKLGVSVNSGVWEKFGPLSCRLNIDEVDDIESTWKEIAKEIDLDVAVVKKAINEARELYITLDHTRTIMMIIQDGSLPSNVGGGCNVRNMLRRVFALLKKNGWWDKLGVDGFCDLCEMHKKDLELIYGKFSEYKSFKEIIQVEYDRWLSTDSSQGSKLEKLLKKNPTLTIDDWITAMSTWGIPADVIAQISKQPVPGNLYYEISQRAERTAKATEVILYNTTHLQETDSIFYTNKHQNDFSFDAKIVDVFKNLKEGNANNIVILDRSAFYPNSGGQATDVGVLTIDGESYNVLTCEKVGKCVLHILDKPLPNSDISHYIGKGAHGSIDQSRRKQLRNHHTATHIVFAACRRVLGPHIWQAGAKKTVEQAHLDITHYTSLTREQEQAIENEANKIVLQGKSIKKGYMDKKEAELEYGFRLYQGGVVPGNQLRVVNIEDTDVEACCGTHCDNTSEVGWIKLIKSSRIADGTVRLYYVAGEKTITRLNKEYNVLTDLQDKWNVPLDQIVMTGDRFFNDFKRLDNENNKKDRRILSLQAKYVLSNPNLNKAVIRSDQKNPTLYFSYLALYASEIKAKGKGIAFLGDNFVYGIVADKKGIDTVALKTLTGFDVKTKNDLKGQNSDTKEKYDVKDILQFNLIGDLKVPEVQDFLQKNGFELIDV